MKLFRCGCEWSGEEAHYCASYPKHGERVQKIYKSEPPSALESLPQAEVEIFKFLNGLTNDGHARALCFIESFAPLFAETTNQAR